MNVLLDLDSPIDLMPATTVEEVVQNVRMIVGVQRGTVPVDRVFGIDASALDSPINAVRARLAADIAQSIRVFEPRARLLALDFKTSSDGVLEPVVKIAVSEGS